MWSRFADDLKESSDKVKAVLNEVKGWQCLDPV